MHNSSKTVRGKKANWSSLVGRGRKYIIALRVAEREGEGKKERERQRGREREREKERERERETERKRERGNNYCTCAAAPTSANSPHSRKADYNHCPFQRNPSHHLRSSDHLKVKLQREREREK